jgi:uncharacterized membrane protein YedE/YeeE
MSAPFLDSATAGDVRALVAALVIGTAFGACLERSGMGSARKLVGQFYLDDMAVLKVMFSAIITAMLGVFWLARLGLLDLARVYVPETFLVPQLAGGLVFGIGFALAGLCPGTSCVAAASGRRDGLAVMLGMFAGVFVTGLGFGRIEAFYATTPRGTMTLPGVLHLSYGATVLLVVVVALAAFRAAELIESRTRARLRA